MDLRQPADRRSVFFWRDAELAAEFLIEIGNIMKSIFHGRLHDGAVGFRKELRGMEQTAAIDVFHAGHSRISVKEAHEMGAAEMAEPGQLIYGEIFRIMRLNMGKHFLQLFRMLSARSRIFIPDHIAILIGQPEKAE